jgi:hypothetical protein
MDVAMEVRAAVVPRADPDEVPGRHEGRCGDGLEDEGRRASDLRAAREPRAGLVRREGERLNERPASLLVRRITMRLRVGG